MEKLIATLVLCVSLGVLSAQPQVHRIGAGKHLVSGVDIMGTEYTFPRYIHNFHIDSASNTITLQLRNLSKSRKWLSNKGNLVLFDLAAEQQRWVRKINFPDNIEQSGSLILHNDEGRSHCLDFGTGKNLWATRNGMLHIDSEYGIGLGYRYRQGVGYSYDLEGIDMTDGTRLWERRISWEYGWNNVRYLNDSVLLIVASGLHSLNLSNGRGWDYKAATGEEDYPSIVSSSMVGEAFGLHTGSIVRDGGYDVVHGLVSNVILAPEGIYMASRKKIFCLGYDGVERWASPLSGDLASTGTIFVRGGRIYLINLGYAFKGDKKVDHGQPYMAAFDIQTGERLFQTIGYGERHPICGFMEHNGTISLVFNDLILNFSLADGSLLLQKTIDTRALGELSGFIADHVYVKSGKGFEQLTASDTTKYYLSTTQKKLFVLDSNLEIISESPLSDFHVCYLDTGQYKFIEKDGGTMVTDSLGSEVASLDVGRSAILIGANLYEIQANRIVQIDLSAFLSEHPLARNESCPDTGE